MAALHDRVTCTCDGSDSMYRCSTSVDVTVLLCLYFVYSGVRTAGAVASADQAVQPSFYPSGLIPDLNGHTGSFIGFLAAAAVHAGGGMHMFRIAHNTRN